MKQIIPFKKELLFQTKVSEITSISLEHTLSLKNDSLINGEFYITGDYKMTEGSINREKFSFQLPFEITLASSYDTSSIIIDIDNFYYEIINNESLQVNIDVYIEGEKIETKPETLVEDLETNENLTNEEIPVLSELNFPDLSNFIIKEQEPEKENITLERNIEYPQIKNITFEDESTIINDNYNQETKTILKKNNEFQLFENVDNSDTYVTYHVYIVKETDNIDTILNKYQVSKEDLSLYNNIEEIKPGMKLIIPN